MRSYLLFVTLILILGAGGAGGAGAAGAALAGPGHAPDEMLIRYKPGKSASVKSLAAAAGARAHSENSKTRYHRFKLPAGADLEATLARLRKNPSVEYAGPNHYLQICQAQVFPNDPVFYGGDDFFGIPSWGLYNDGDNNGQGGLYRADIHAPEAWAITTGNPSVVIASIDTGVDYTHEDLATKLWTNPGEIPDNGIDDDGNGKVDDWRGWDFVTNSNDPYDDNEVQHGTFTSGIAAAASNNYAGIAGVSWGSPILACKVIRADGYGLESDAADAVVYAVDLGVRVINMSLSGEDVPALRDAVEYAWQHGAICVVASGNDGTYGLSYPASYPNALAVGASNENDARCTSADWMGSGGSNYGDYLDVMAPGSWIVGPGPGLLGGIYQTQPGTSAAAPFVSGEAALIWSKHPDWTNAQVYYQILQTADDIEDPGWDIYSGYGRVNAYRALTEEIAATPTINATRTLPAGTAVYLQNKLLSTSSTDIPNRLYIQEDDRSSGLLLSFAGAPPEGLNAGDRVNVLGALTTISGERGIRNPLVTKVGSDTPPQAYPMTNRALGGGPAGQQTGVVDHYSLPREMAKGANNIGLLVTSWGRVTAVAYDWFYMDDGNNLDDGTGHIGVCVSNGVLERPSVGQYALITGISGCEIPAGSPVARRVLRPRNSGDIAVVPPH